MARPETPTTKILRGARDLIARRGGWTQNTYDNGRGAYCAVGALRQVACGNTYLPNRAPAGYTNAYRLLDRTSGGNILGFNDRGSTRKKDVLTAFDRAIELAESQH